PRRRWRPGRVSRAAPAPFFKLGSAVADAALVPGAMGAAIHPAASLDAMPDDRAMAMRAAWGHRVDRAFETVEAHRAAAGRDLERLVVVVAANVAFGHLRPPQSCFAR